MIFEPGKEKDRVPVLQDGLPVWAEHGEYVISRAVTAVGIRSDAWLRQYDASGRRDLPLQLAGSVTAREALKACQGPR